MPSTCRLLSLVAATVLAGGLEARVGAQAPPAGAAPAGAMAGHFAEIGQVHDAVIRGDLAAARRAAGVLAAGDSEGLPAKTRPSSDQMKMLAGRVAAATDVAAAASGTAAMLGTCGECHLLAGAHPAPALPDRPAVGQTVGHMLDHQRALDRMMQGLVVPSSALWNEGAQALRVAPLASGKLPKDPKLTPDVAAGEQRVHQLADQAAGTSDPQARSALYGELLGTCARCHSLHANIWGPTRR